MSATDRAHAIASAISEGLNCLAYIRAAHATSVVVSAEEIVTWCETLGSTQRNLEALQALAEAGQADTSLSMSHDLPRRIEDLRAHLSMAQGGAPLPEAVLSSAALAWAAFERAMSS